MRKIFLFMIIILFAGCQKEKISFSDNASDVFYVENEGAAMRVLVQGNTSSKTFILIIHGGPGREHFSMTQNMSAKKSSLIMHSSIGIREMQGLHRGQIMAVVSISI
jgi:hypothetical protein